jgi:hypothetical protein
VSEPKEQEASMPETIIRSIIPAAPGWFVIEHCNGGLAEEPVIAWIITAHCDEDTVRHSEARPVTADYATNEIWLVIKRPDGRYIADGGERFFDSVAELLEYFRERENKARAQRE